MDSSTSNLELTLSLKPSTFVSKSLNNLLNDLAQIDSAPLKLSKLEICLRQHQEELLRVQASLSNLPHCMVLLKDAIEMIQDEILTIKNGRVDYDHHTKLLVGNKRKQPERPDISPSGHDLVPMVRPNKWSQVGQQEGSGTNLTPKFNIGVNNSTMPTIKNHLPPSPIEISRNGRRIGTSELRSRFMDAINDLGGAEAATPKLIIDKMRVEGLTNDQVKSHLQKLRIYKKAGLPVSQAGAGSSSSAGGSGHTLHQPAMATQEQWTDWTTQSQVPRTRDVLSTGTGVSTPSSTAWQYHKDGQSMHQYGNWLGKE